MDPRRRLAWRAARGRERGAGEAVTKWMSHAGGRRRWLQPVRTRGFERLVVAGVGMAQHTCPRIGGQDTLEALGHLVRAVGDDDHAGVDRIADADAATVVDAHPG